MKIKTNLFRSHLVLIFVLSLILVNTGKAQEIKIYELFDNNSQTSTAPLSKSGKTAKAAVANSTYTDDLNKFNDLNYSLKPTIYIQNNSIVNVTENEIPLKVKLEDAQSFNIIKSNNPLFQTVELMVINIENSSDLNNGFDVSALQSFSSLKYIYIQCQEFNSSVDQIQRFITNPRPEITIYFMTLNPS